MKKKKYKLFFIVVLIVLTSVSVLYIVEKNKVEITLLNEELNYEAYSLVSLNKIISKIDQDKSTYENMTMVLCQEIGQFKHRETAALMNSKLIHVV